MGPKLIALRMTYPEKRLFPSNELRQTRGQRSLARVADDGGFHRAPATFCNKNLDAYPARLQPGLDVRMHRYRVGLAVLEHFATVSSGGHKPEAPAKDAAGPSLALQACVHRYSRPQTALELPLAVVFRDSGG